MIDLNGNEKELIKELEKCSKQGEKKYFNGENSAAYDIFSKCEELAIRAKDPKWIAESTKNVGRIYHRMGKYEEAKKKYLKALDILNLHSFISEKPRYLNHLASVYQFTNEFDKQCECLREALKISEELGDYYSKAKINNSIGVYYEIFGEYEKALNYMEKSLEYFKIQKSNYTLVKSYNLISSVKTKMEDFDSALVDAKKAYEIARSHNDVYNIAYSLRNIIRIFYNQEKYEKCLDFFDELLEVKDKLENKKMNCDILRIIGLVYQKFKEQEKAYAALRDSLNIAKEINYYHGVAKSNEFLGDFLFESGQYLEAYRNYSNALRIFQLILNSIMDPKLKENYRILFERLPKIINKVDSILDQRSYEFSSNEMEAFSKEATILCKQVQKEDLDENISKECSNNVKKLNTTKNKDFELREKILDEWCNILGKACFMKLDKETQDHLIRYKLNILKIPDDYESFIRRISYAIECEIRTKLFEGFRDYWNKEMNIELKPINDNSLNQIFITNYNNLKSYIEKDRFLELGRLYFILKTVLERRYFNEIPKEYTLPFRKFEEYIGTKNMRVLKKIAKFFDKKYRCGSQKHYFIIIRNNCSHGGGRMQEKRKNIEIEIKQDTIEEIESNLLNKDINLLDSLCSFEI